MLDEILAEIRNYFVDRVHKGTFTIIGGRLAPPSFLKSGQYFKIIGSTFNDGVYQYPELRLTDETFSGEIWALAIPPKLIALAADIQKYDSKIKANPYASESFGGYSYSRATGSNGAPISWQIAFAKKLNNWRKI